MRTEILVVLDRSGSMEDIKAEMCSGFDSFIATQRAIPGEAYVTLVQFDSMGIDTVYARVPLTLVPSLVLEPRGGTPLLDAMGGTIKGQGERFDRMSRDTKPEAVIMVVITDGLENSSRKYTRDQVREMVQLQQKEWGWTFLYIGADQDAIHEAHNYGLMASMSLDTAKTPEANAGMYSVLNKAVAHTRSTGAQYNITSDDRDEALGGTWGGNGGQ